MKSMHMNKLKDSVGVFAKHAARLVKDLEGKVGGGEFDVHPYLNLTNINTFLGEALAVKWRFSQ